MTRIAAGVLLATWLAAGSAFGFVGEVNASGQARRWALNPTDTRVQPSSVNRSTRAIVYRLDTAAYSPAGAPAELNAIRAAFDQWQAIGGTVLRFEEGASMSGITDINSRDHTNTLFWTRSRTVNGGRDDLSGILALTYVASFSDGNVIFDADTVFNGADFRWFTDIDDPTTEGVFVEAIALHEIGHALGLRHSPVGGATLLAVGDRGVNSQVGLAPDEVSAARSLYGTSGTLAASARVTGRVTAGGIPVFGAAVFAEDARGNVVAGTVTRSDGAYALPGLDPGAYTVRSSPLDPPGANYLVRGIDIADTYAAAQTGFLPTDDRAVTLTPGAGIVADFDVFGGFSPRLVRLLRPAPDLSSPGYNNKPVSVAPAGQTVYVGGLTSESAAVEMHLSVTGDGLTVGPTEVRANALPGLTLVAAPVTFAASATPGLRSLRLQRGTRIGWVHGFLEILPAFPDANFDGLDDRFQRRYWPRFTLPEAAPAADPDQDGFDNRWENDTGSDPTNRLSAHFSIESVRVTAAGAQVRSQTAKGRRFQLFTRETVPGSEWVAVGAPVVATSGLTEFLDPGATTAVRFYRVQLLP